MTADDVTCPFVGENSCATAMSCDGDLDRLNAALPGHRGGQDALRFEAAKVESKLAQLTVTIHLKSSSMRLAPFVMAGQLSTAKADRML